MRRLENWKSRILAALIIAWACYGYAVEELPLYAVAHYVLVAGMLLTIHAAIVRHGRRILAELKGRK